MQIEAIGSAIPSRLITNRDIIELIEFHNFRKYSQLVKEYTEELQRLFHLSGAQNRYWCFDKERPIDLVVAAVEDALRQSNMAVRDVDVLIYCGIHKGFLEPAMASIIARQMGMVPKMCFDVVDACLGWGTSLEVCQALFNERKIGSTLIISSEFPVESEGVIDPACFKFDDPAELRMKFPALTMGEGAAATILSKDGGAWEFHRREKPEDANLCSVPLRNFRSFVDYDPYFGANGEEVFCAVGDKMAQNGFRPGLEVLRALIQSKGTPAIVFPHSVSKAVPERAIGMIGTECAVYTTFELFGNLSTASLPIALHHAVKNDKLDQKNNIFGWVASAGMKFSSFNIMLNSELLN